jgi:hypothetical protein
MGRKKDRKALKRALALVERIAKEIARSERERIGGTNRPREWKIDAAPLEYIAPSDCKAARESRLKELRTLEGFTGHSAGKREKIRAVSRPNPILPLKAGEIIPDFAEKIKRVKGAKQ